MADQTGGGIFEAILTQLLPGPNVPAGPSQDQAAAQLSALVSKESASAAGAINATAASHEIPAIGNTKFASSPLNSRSTIGAQPPDWQTALSIALAKRMQSGAKDGSAIASSPAGFAALMQGLPVQPGAQSPPENTGASSAASFAAMSSGHGNPSVRAARSTTVDLEGTALSRADIVAALQSLAAQQSAPVSAGPQAATASSSNNASLKPASSGPVSLLQVLKAAQAETLKSTTTAPGQVGASTKANSNSATNSQSSAQATTSNGFNAAQDTTNTSVALAAQFAKSSLGALGAAAASSDAAHAQFAQATHNALHEAPNAPVTEAQALPLHFALGSGNGNGGTNGQSGGQPGSHTATSSNSNASANNNTGTNAQVGNAGQPSAQPVHAAAQAAPLSSAQNTAAAPQPSLAAAAMPQLLPMHTTTASLQIGPASQGGSQGPAVDIPAVAVNIATQFQSGARQFDIRLDPPELGRVDVRLTVDAAGKAQAHLAVDKPQTLEMLQRDSGSLARALRDSGVQLNNNGLQFSLKGQSRQSDTPSRSPSRTRALSVSAALSASQAAAGLSSYIFSGSRSGVDIRV